MKSIAKLRVMYAKRDNMRQSSHLDTVNTVRNCVRKSGLQVAQSGGVNPRLRIAFGPPLPAGYTSECEVFDIEVIRRVPPDEAKALLAANFPAGIEVLNVYAVPLLSPPVDSVLNCARYVVQGLPGSDNREQLISAFFAGSEYPIERITDKSSRVIDARQVVLEMKQDGERLVMLLRFGPKKTLKPDVIIQKVFGLNEEQRAKLAVVRTAFYNETQTGEIREI
jgi:radical SAM-linked protein